MYILYLHTYTSIYTHTRGYIKWSGAKDSARLSGSTTNIPLVCDRVISPPKALILSVIRRTEETGESNFKDKQFYGKLIIAPVYASFFHTILRASRYQSNLV